MLGALRQLSAHGIRCVIDDFGTGNANFSQLDAEVFTGIKIDRMFTVAAAAGSPLQTVLPAICQIAERLQLDIVVEGVETEAQEQRLLRLARGTVGQGWLYGMPQTAAEMQRMIDTDLGDSRRTA